MLRRRRLKLVTKLWLSTERLFSERFSNLRQSVSDPDRFDENYVRNVGLEKEKIDRKIIRIGLINSSLILTLFMNAVVGGIDLSVLGISAKNVSQLKEVILFVSATLSFIAAVLGAAAAVKEMHIKAWLSGIEDKMERSVVAISLPGYMDFGDFIPASVRKHVSGTTFTIFLTTLTFFLGLFIYFVLLAVSVAVHIIVVIDVLKSPSLPIFVSWFVIAYVLLIDFICVCLIVLMRLPMPYKDYNLVFELHDLWTSDRKAWEAKMDEIKKEQGIKS